MSAFLKATGSKEQSETQCNDNDYILFSAYHMPETILSVLLVFSCNPYTTIIDTIVLPVLQMGKPRLREVK